MRHCEPLSRSAASVGKKNAPHVIAKERSDCGNLNPYARKTVCFLRRQQSGCGNLKCGDRTFSIALCFLAIRIEFDILVRKFLS